MKPDEYDKTYKELMAAQTHLRDRMFQALKYLGKVERDEYVYVADGSLENTAFLVYAAIKGRRVDFDHPLYAVVLKSADLAPRLRFWCACLRDHSRSPFPIDFNSLISDVRKLAEDLDRLILTVSRKRKRS